MGAEEQELGQTVHSPMLLRSHVDDGFQARKPPARQAPALLSVQLGNQLPDNGDIVRVLEPVDDAERLHVRLPDYVVELVKPIVRIHRHEDDADARRREEDGEPVRDVIRPYADMIALGQADREESLGEAIDPFVEFRVAEAKVAIGVYDKLAVGRLPGPGSQEVADGLIRKSHGRLLRTGRRLWRALWPARRS